jgi:nitrite reductase/ring-hydroxylating ferredoxin subunit
VTATEITAVGAHRLGPVDAIPVGEGRAFAVGGEQVAVFRLRDGSLRAMQASCPHAGGPLADGQIDAVKVVCPLHNHVFAFADGSCASGDFAVRVYSVRDDDGEIVLGDRLPG